jgi:hypothetical protein
MRFRLQVQWGVLAPLFMIQGSLALINNRRTIVRPKGSSSSSSDGRPFAGLPSPSQHHRSLLLKATSKSNGDNANDDDTKTTGKKKKVRKGGAASNTNKKKKDNDDRTKKKEEIMKQLKRKLEEKKESQKQNEKGKSGLLDKLNPFQVGQNLRETLGQLTTLGTGLSTKTKQKYYLDDRFLDGSGVLSERNPYLERLEKDNYVPEILVIGATGEVGRLVVRRLLLEGRFRVRVLVRDLYSQTLNLLGTGVTYCQGDLGNMESLEYALTDVDKIVFCAAAPRPDETDFQEKFQYFVKENLDAEAKIIEKDKVIAATKNDMEWEQLSSVLEVRAQLAEQVDCIGVQNLVKAYQNVRHADYGTSQAAKRSLFKFSGRPEDFNLFALDNEDTGGSIGDGENDDTNDSMAATDSSDDDEDPDDEDQYAEYNEDYYDEDDEDYDEEYYDDLEARRDATVQSQTKWIRNEFGHGVFVGKVPKADSSGVGGEAAIVSSRLRSREDPDSGIDLSTGFAGFIVRLCGDGGKYEAFIRSKSYEEDGIEYVCDFPTSTKPTSRDNKSRNKFITVRLPFENFKPVLRKEKRDGEADPVVPPFKGADVRNMGFRYRSGSNERQAKVQDGENVSFYISLSYVKVYRLQPEPEFVYLSDARIPSNIKNGMVRHDRRRLLTDEGSRSGEGDVVQILDEKALKNQLERSHEETYYKYRGEEILKSSGLR